MIEILAVALRGMHQDMMRLDQVAMNLTNSATPGYKRQTATAKSFSQVADAYQGTAALAVSADPAVTGVASHIDRRAGTLKGTGQPRDSAIDGNGYFEVATESGPAYTRQGNFTVDPRGRLVTAQGHAVMGTGGEILLSGVTPSVDASGNLWDKSDSMAGQAARPIGQLKIVHLDPGADLQSLGNGLMTTTAEPVAVTGADAQVKQGYLENSNVTPVHEMVQLMQIMRHFESLQKAAQGYDEMIGNAVRKLGDLS